MLYSLLILAHILSDFTFQSENTSKNKRESNFSLLKHGIIVFVISYILTIHYLSVSHLLMISLLSLLHVAVDYTKVRLTNKFSNYNLELFIFDQLFHFFVIFIILIKKLYQTDYLTSVKITLVSEISAFVITGVVGILYLVALIFYFLIFGFSIM